MLANFFRRRSYEEPVAANSTLAQPLTVPAAAAKPAAAQEGKTELEEKFARIVTQITLMWGYPEMDTYFNKLWIDDRGDRAGFPKAVMEDLMFLASLHQIAHPQQPSNAYANRGLNQDIYYRNR
jgi:hypothetical protein